MTQSTPERKPCGTCGEEYTVTAAGGMRSHFTDNSAFQAGPDSRKCKGVGQPPAGAEAPGDSANGPQCRLCKHPVQLTGNGRVRSHLTPEATPRPCPGGSDFPLGTYPDMAGTTDGLVATLTRDCGHVPAGECYDCYGESVKPVSDTEPAETITHTGTNAAVVAAAPTMADQFKAAGDEQRGYTPAQVQRIVDSMAPAVDDDRPQASRFTELLAREAGNPGTVLDRIDPAVFRDHRTEAQKAHDAEMSRLTREAIKVLEQRSPEEKAETAARMDRAASAALGVSLDPALNHNYADPSGIEWVHQGPAETCEAPDCVAMRSDNPEGFDPNCAQCDTDNHRCPGCGEAVPHGTVACMPCGRETCTHPNGFKGTADDYDSDGQDRVVSVCELCGTVDPEDAEDVEPASPDPERPNCPHPGTHRAGCGCPDDDSTEPKDPGLLCEQVRVGELDEGDIFTRRGTRMRVTGETNGVVHAVVVDGPHKGRTGDLPNLGEIVERDRVSRDPHVREVEAAIAAIDAEDSWRTPADMLALMSEEIRGMDALRFNCADCGHPITPLIDQFSFDGRAAVVRWVCEPACKGTGLSCNGKHECRPDCLINVGDLEFGDHFVRRGVLMRATSSGYGAVEAVVVEGPHKGRTGELKNPAEQVERTYCRHEYSHTYDEIGSGVDHSGWFCDYCGTEQETTECKDNPEARTSPRSSSVPVTPTASPTTAPAPGSKPPTKASVPTASPRSTSETPSAPTVKAAGRDRSAAVTTDQASAAAAFLGNGRPSAPATNRSANQAEAAAQFLAGPAKAKDDKDRYDGYGRYKVTHPDTGKPVKWTRATTFAKSVSNTYALNKYDQRLVLLGATMRPDIRDRAHGKHVRADKDLLDALATDLREAAGSAVAANKGTTVHGFTEAVDHAWHTPEGPRSVLATVPPEYQVVVGTYIHLLEHHGLEPIPYLTEFTTAVKQYQVAGTSDNCYKVTKPLTVKTSRGEVHLAPGEYVIGDKKSGRSLEFAQREIAIQLGTYAQGLNTSGRFDWDTRTWDADPLGGAKVRTDVGLVVHLPVDDDATDLPSVQGVDTESGWNAAVLCERVRAWHKVKTLGSVVVGEVETFAPARPAPAVVTQTTVRPPSLRDRANNVTSNGEASAVWQDAKKQGLPDAEVDELVAVMKDRLRKLAEPGG